MVCPEDVTERKPHPESLLRNCRELGCTPDQAIYIGDHLRDIEAGKRAGMYTIAAAYGYIEPGDDPYSWGADAHAEQQCRPAKNDPGQLRQPARRTPSPIATTQQE